MTRTGWSSESRRRRCRRGSCRYCGCCRQREEGGNCAHSTGSAEAPLRWHGPGGGDGKLGGGGNTGERSAGDGGVTERGLNSELARRDIGIDGGRGECRAAEYKPGAGKEQSLPCWILFRPCWIQMIRLNCAERVGGVFKELGWMRQGGSQV
jgi:hypothetical protein